MFQLKMKHVVRKKIFDSMENWMLDDGQPPNHGPVVPAPQERRALCQSKRVGCRFFWGLPRFGLGHPWADCLVTVNEHRSHRVICPPARGFFGIFLCLLRCDTMKECICGWSSYLVLGFHLSAHSPSSLKKKKQRAQSCCSPYWEEELHSELRPRDFYSCTHTSAQQAAFRGKGEGTDVWKSTTDIKR